MFNAAFPTVQTFIFIHVIISMVGIMSGLVVLFGMLAGMRHEWWTAVFLATTLLTSLTGFCFLPFKGFTPAQVFGIISTVLLALAIYGLYVRHLAGPWRKTYAITALIALYLNVLVGVIQSFQKNPFLHSLAPTQTELPFVLTQGVFLVLFATAGFFAVRRFKAPLT